MRVVCFLLVLAQGLLVKTNDSPVTRVVELLSDLKAKIEADGRAEQAIYDKYACWCEETTARKAAAIEEGKTAIEELSQRILELNAAQGSDTATLAKLKKDIASNKESTAKSEALRKNENNAYLKTKSELEQAINNLERAVQVLGDGTTHESKEKDRWNAAGEPAMIATSSMANMSPAMRETKMLTVAAGVRSAMRLYSRKDKDDMIGQDFSSVKSFLSDPTSMVLANVGSPHLQEYSTQSGAIQGILKQMLDDFNTNLENSGTEETEKQTDYDALMTSKREDLALLSSTLTSKTTSSGNDGKELADNTLERKETEAQLKEDEAFFQTLKDGCKTKATNWADRSRVRTEELNGISQAVEILSSEDASGTFEASATTFLQTGAARTPQKAAYNALKKAATKAKSVQLAALASKLYTAGHFDEVLSAIDDMIAHCRQEEVDDQKKRDWCETERSNANSKNQALEYDLEELTNKIARQNNAKTELGNEITKTETAMSDLQSAMDTALADRNEEHTQYQTALKDDTDAVALLAKAIEVLASFYDGSTDKFIQLPAEKTETKKQNPDDEPESGPASYGGQQTAGTGIVTILEMIKEDVQKEMKTAMDEEHQALLSYEKLLSESNGSMNAMKTKKTTLERDVAGVNMEIANTEAVHGDKDASKTATDTYLSDLAPNCDWVMNTFDTRTEQRKAEIAGLSNAKSILGGAGYEGVPALVAAKSSASTTQVEVKKVAPAAPKDKAHESVDDALKELDADALTFGNPAFLQRK